MRTEPPAAFDNRQSLTHYDAILRHAGEAVSVVKKYRGLNATDRSNLMAFLGSL